MGIRGIGRVLAATNGALTTLQRLDQKGDDHVIHEWDAVNFRGLGEFSTSVNQCLGEKTVAVIAPPVRYQKGMLRELGAPCKDGGDECWVKGVFLLTPQNGAMATSMEVESSTELGWVEEGKTSVNDLEVDLDEI